MDSLRLQILLTVVFLVLQTSAQPLVDQSQIIGQPSSQVSETELIDLRLPPEDQVLIPLTQQPPAESFLPAEFEFITWNIHKASDGERWAQDLQHLARQAQIVILQEAMRDEFVPAVLLRLPFFSFQMAQSFLYKDGRGTGTASGSTALLLHRQAYRSPGLEPMTKTPKMTLATTYLMEDGVKLLVLNVHGINFVTNPQFRDQIEALRPVIQNFAGRIIFAGDFNTWNPGRTTFLEAFAQGLGFTEVKFEKDSRHIFFDHIFLRGCHSEGAEVLNQIKSSDHFPLRAELHCP